MKLHHWVVPTNNNIKSFYSNPLFNQIELDNKIYFAYGELLDSPHLINPLMLGLTIDQRNIIANHILLGKFKLDITLNNDSDRISKALEKESDFTGLLLFHDFAQQLFSLSQAIGWSFLSFHKQIKPGSFSIILKSNFNETIDVLRGLFLLRACLEILSCERGFVLHKCSIQNARVEIDLLSAIIDKFAG
jgi:hypothetical protein